LRCFRCNGFGKIARIKNDAPIVENMVGKVDCSDRICPNCKGNHSAANEACPNYEKIFSSFQNLFILKKDAADEACPNYEKNPKLYLSLIYFCRGL